MRALALLVTSGVLSLPGARAGAAPCAPDLAVVLAARGAEVGQGLLKSLGPRAASASAPLNMALVLAHGARVKLPLVGGNPPADQLRRRRSLLGGLLRRLAASTPSAPLALASAVRLAHGHLGQRADGLGRFRRQGPDPLRRCRRRLVLLLVDDAAAKDAALASAVRRLVRDRSLRSASGRGVTLSLMGVRTGARAQQQLVALARALDSGPSVQVQRASSAAMLGRLVGQLVRELLRQERAVGAPLAVSVSPAAGQPPALLGIWASVEQPGQRGHLRATDLSRPDSAPLWDAGKLLAAMPWRGRVVLTLSPRGELVRLPLDPSPADRPALGRLLPAGLHVGAAAQARLLRALAGAERSWKLPPLSGAMAFSGPPPRRGRRGAAYVAFTRAHAQRPALLFAVSAHGVHALRASDGHELFLLVPPSRWPRLLAAAGQGGGWTSPPPAGLRVAQLVTPQGRWSTQLLLHSAGELLTLDVSDPLRCAAGDCAARLIHLLPAGERPLGASAPAVWSLTAARPALVGLTQLSRPVAATAPMVRGLLLSWAALPRVGPPPEDAVTRIARELTLGGAPSRALFADGNVAAKDPAMVLALGPRVVRIARPGAAAQVVAQAGDGQRFVQPPAAFRRHDGALVLAAASRGSNGAVLQLDTVPPRPGPAGPGATSAPVVEEVAGAPGPRLRCPLARICSCPDLASSTSDCIAPEASAMPAGQPLIVARPARALRVVQLLRAGQPNTCGRGPGGWLVVLELDARGGKPRLLSSRSLPGGAAVGLAPLPGDDLLLLQQPAADGLRPRLHSLSGRPLRSGSGAVRLEAWRVLD